MKLKNKMVLGALTITSIIIGGSQIGTSIADCISVSIRNKINKVSELCWCTNCIRYPYCFYNNTSIICKKYKRFIPFISIYKIFVSNLKESTITYTTNNINESKSISFCDCCNWSIGETLRHPATNIVLSDDNIGYKYMIIRKNNVCVIPDLPINISNLFIEECHNLWKINAGINTSLSIYNCILLNSNGELSELANQHTWHKFTKLHLMKYINKDIVDHIFEPYII